MITITLKIKDCASCPNLEYQEGMMEHYYCNITKKEIVFTKKQTIPEWCPYKK